MKALLATTAIAAALVLAALPASARMTRTMASTGMYPWMMDDGSSSDFPVHMRGDISGDRLNSQYLGGITTAPGTGFPAYPDQR
ncbi:MAG TPA: hypothetical protein VM782_18655 [Stellaceae bacterium]|nr:hypothetical protein [Stellaceae bacterium]